LKKEWSKEIAQTFQDKTTTRIIALQSHPYIGAPTGVKNVRSTLITKHNRMFYRIEGSKIAILNLYDTRKKQSGKTGS